MSVDNSELLMLLGGKKTKSTIGIAGQQGFGVGVYGGSPSDLNAMGLAPMEGCEDPTSDNYGNYIHTNGSVMVFIPAFCYRIGNESAPSYSRDAENALEIRDASEGVGGGWILHRAFIDGGVQKLGFFIDKYICSKDASGTAAVSVKNGDGISLGTIKGGSDDMPGCEGAIKDALILGRARGEHYSCVTAFQWSAISMLSLAHGQAATDSQFCGWYDASHNTNYPKGYNNGALGDVEDSSVKWLANSNYAAYGKTGSGTPFNKTTHNGQNCGVADVCGIQDQVAIGKGPSGSKGLGILKESVKAHDFQIYGYSQTEFFDTFTFTSTTGWWGPDAFFLDEDGVNRAMCGIFPKVVHTNSDHLFGSYSEIIRDHDFFITVGGTFSDALASGVWKRACYYHGTAAGYVSFRISGYAN